MDMSLIQHLVLNIEETVSIILFGVGFTILLLHRNLIKKIMGMNITEKLIKSHHYRAGGPHCGGRHPGCGGLH